MGTILNDRGIVCVPSWAVNGHPLLAMDPGSFTEPASFSQAAVPACPNGGDWFEQDETLGAGGYVTIVGDVGPGNHGAGDTKRYADVWTRLFYQTARPNQLVSVWGGTTGATLGNAVIGVLEDTTGIFSLAQGTGGTVAGSYATAINTTYYLELWHVFDDSAGNSLGSVHHWQLRVYTLNAAGSPPTLQDTIDAYFPTNIGGFAYTFQNRMPWTSCARKSYGSHFTHDVEDADHPFGLHRAMWYQPSADSALNNAWAPQPATATKYIRWQEVPPDDAATYLDNTGTSGAQNQTSKVAAGAGFSAAQTPTVADTILGASVIARTYETVSKGGTAVIHPMISDGTHNAVSAISQSIVSAYQPMGAFWHLRPDGTATWVFGDIATWEIGLQGNNSLGACEDYATSTQGFISWVKSGETTVPVAGPDVQVTRRRYGAII
jgi:hypothetical protein